MKIKLFTGEASPLEKETNDYLDSIKNTREVVKIDLVNIDNYPYSLIVTEPIKKDKKNPDKDNNSNK